MNYIFNFRIKVYGKIIVIGKAVGINRNQVCDFLCYGDLDFFKSIHLWKYITRLPLQGCTD